MFYLVEVRDYQYHQASSCDFYKAKTLRDLIKGALDRNTQMRGVRFHLYQGSYRNLDKDAKLYSDQVFQGQRLGMSYYLVLEDALTRGDVKMVSANSWLRTIKWHTKKNLETFLATKNQPK